MGEVVKDSVIQRTQKLLGKHITKPTLTPKLLQKPPFRFLHDIVTSVIRERGFLKGLYAENELVSENIKEREAKVAFLTKLIDALSTISGSEIDVKPSRIVAGLEPTKTNKLLQALGTALDNKLDSKEYVKNLAGVTKPEKSKSKTVKKVGSDRTSKGSKPELSSTRKDSKTNVEKISKGSKSELNSTRKEPRTKETKKPERDQKKKGQKVISTPKDVLDSPADNKKETKMENKEDIEEKILENVIEKSTVEIKEPEPEVKEDTLETKEDPVEKELSVEQSEQPPSRAGTAKVRPKSARIQPDLTKPDIKHKDVSTASMSNFLRPPSVRPPSARPGAPRLRPDSTLPTNEVIPLGNINVIVENFNKEPDEEETVVIQNVESELEQPTVEDVLNIPQDKGHLVEQILKEINDVDDYTQAKSNRTIEDTHARDVTHREIAQLQISVQALTKVANPLGKLMNYLHEDVDGMHVELTSWINAKKQCYAEIKKQKEQHDNSSSALKQQLSELDENIVKMESEISQTQANILRNDLRIKQLLTNRV